MNDFFVQGLLSSKVRRQQVNDLGVTMTDFSISFIALLRNDRIDRRSEIDSWELTAQENGTPTGSVASKVA